MLTFAHVYLRNLPGKSAPRTEPSRKVNYDAITPIIRTV